MSSQKSTSYAAAAQQECNMTKDQAVIIEAIENVTLEEYVKVIATKVNPTDIRFIGRMSNKRIGVYLASKALAEQLVEQHKTIMLANRVLPIRPLITKEKRIIISNVPPIIPNSLLEKIFIERNISLSSPITYIRAGLKEPGFSHILSFRRQVFIKPEYLNQIPQSVQISYDDTNYYVYLATDTITCFICKQEGHIARNCHESNGPQEMLLKQTATSNITKIQENDKEKKESTDFDKAIFVEPELPLQKLNKPTTIDEPIFKPLETLGKKRALSTDTTSSTQSIKKLEIAEETKRKPDMENKSTEKIKLRSKRQKKNENNDDLASPLGPVEDEMVKNPELYPINFLQLKNFLEKSKGKQNIHEITKGLTTNNTELVTMLRNLYLFLDGRGIKIKFSKIIKRLEENNTTNNTDVSDDYASDISESETDNSVMSQGCEETSSQVI